MPCQVRIMMILNATVSTRQLIYFIAVAELSSFRRAAEKLHMSQPPLTQQIQALERSLGAELFDRNKRQVELTSAGAEFLEEAKKIITLMNRSFERARAVSRGMCGRIRVGMTDDFVYSPALSSLLRFARENRDLVIETYVEISTNLLRQLSQNELDIVLTNSASLSEGRGFVERRLPGSRIMLLVPKSHRLAHRKSIAASDLVDEPIIHTPDDSPLPMARQCENIFAEAGVTLNVAYRTTNASVAARLAAEGLGIALVSEYSVMPTDTLVCVPLCTTLRLEHVLLHVNGRLSPVVERLVAALPVNGRREEGD